MHALGCFYVNCIKRRIISIGISLIGIGTWAFSYFYIGYELDKKKKILYSIR